MSPLGFMVQLWYQGTLPVLQGWPKGEWSHLTQGSGQDTLDMFHERRD